MMINISFLMNEIKKSENPPIPSIIKKVLKSMPNFIDAYLAIDSGGCG